MDPTLPPASGGGDRMEPVDIQQEMQRSYIDYAMSVIVGRALPLVEDGLKPVHRRVLYSMGENGFRPDRSYVKCARVVGEVMGNYHPHGDSSIYDALVRLAQPWSMRYPLIDGQGNFGSRGNDPAAAMRYCVTGDTAVATPDGDVRIDAFVPGQVPDSTVEVDLKVIGLHGVPVRATAVHHSGTHEVLAVRAGGRELRCTANHPLLTNATVAGLPTLLWKLAEELVPGDVIASTGSQTPSEAHTQGGTCVPTPQPVCEPVDPARLVPDSPGVDAFSWVRVDSVVPAGSEAVYSLRVDTVDHAFVTDGFVSHNTECRLSPLAMAMLQDIEEDTVGFSDNYDGKSQEPDVLPSRVPNLLINGSSGIAVGMATNIPPHNLREVGAGVVWALDNWDASEEDTLTALMGHIKGPDFPTAGLIVGRDGIESAYRTGRGSVRMRAVVEVEEDAKGRTILVCTELPYQVNPDNLIESIATQHRDGKLAGIAEINDESSDRIGMRIVITLKRDAVAKVVLNNLYKHTQLQYAFGVNMLSIVDGVPRTLRLDQMVRHYIRHQIEVIVRRTRYRLRKAEERAHILRGYVKALDALDEVIALIRASQTVEIARAGLIELLDVDELQAQAILDLQLRRLAALERQKIIDELAEIERTIADLQDILDRPERQRQIVRDELTEIVEKHGDERRTDIVADDGDVTNEDLIAVEDIVVTITQTGYAKRTKTDLYRAQKRGGKGVQGAALKQDDIVAHFFVCSTHDWMLFFTTKGRVYRLKGYELPEANRSARGQHVANLLALQPDEHIAQVMQIKHYEVAPYLVLATRTGLVKKSRLTDFDSPRTGGLIGINLREDDELVGAVLCSAADDLLLVSAEGQSIRFTASDEVLRPMGRATSGVLGMRFNAGDRLLSLAVVQDGTFVLVATAGGYAKRTPIEDYPVQGRGGKGVLTLQYDRRRGTLVGALIVGIDDELYAITSTGGVIRTSAREVRKAGRQTKGVRLMNLGDSATLLAVARNAEDDADNPDLTGGTG
ncbi:DNA gyrase subunit A [Pseudonocardia sp.]|uniref:DNA gyrase subunit A n=1 Tax=Pseudonocardia sp. TaxID=60912 RepID=UPI00262E5B2D|nr:DNA gyrase subunit A [Pseudonocardia sp.]